MRKRTYLHILILFFLCSFASLQAVAGEGNDAITPAEAKLHIGERKTVCGKVANTYYSCFTKGKPTFINFGAPYPDHNFSLAIPGDCRDLFAGEPETLFEKRELCATGLIEEYDDKPLMIVRDANQIEWR